LVNVLVHAPPIGDVLLRSVAVTDERKLGADEHATIMAQALESHGLCGVRPPASPLTEQPVAGSRALQFQQVAAVATDNCSTAIASANKFIENAKAKTVGEHGDGAVANAINMIVARCIPHAASTMCSAGTWSLFILFFSLISFLSFFSFVCSFVGI
jgi:hypothetical protein